MDGELKPKICVYAISKNEDQFVERFCKSAKEADMILIADTGSTDQTAEEARKHGAIVHDICISPWRFDLARNAALSLIPRTMDICISLDLDELLEPGWREEIERVWKLGETTRLRYYFDWGCGIKFKYEKIHARHGYRWHHPCHEYPVPDGRITEVWADTDMLLVSHHPDPTKSRGQYLDLLRISVEEDPHCPRNAFYYARELSFHGRWGMAIEECKRYLALPKATWMNERCYAYRVMGKCYEEIGDWWEAEKAFHAAAAEAPNTREPWCELAMLTYRQRRWEETFAFSMRALKIRDKQLVYTCDPAVWGHWAHDLASISAWHLGMKDIAIEQARLACEKSPDDQRLALNLKFVMGELEEENGEAA
jgi:glycosyltransferase involved in cell wall biosynthesis